MTRRNFLQSTPISLPFFTMLAARAAKTVKITAIKTLALDNVGDGCLIKVETDAGLAGYGEAGIPAKAARARIDMLQRDLIGQDPLAIEKHFHQMVSTQYSFMAHVPTVSGIDIALWDLAGKILGQPVYKLLGGPFRQSVAVYSHGGRGTDMSDKAAIRDWAQKVRQAPEGFTLFKFGFGGGGGGRGAEGGTRPAFVPTLSRGELLKVARGYANAREALGDEIEIAMHGTGQFDLPSAIGLARAAEPMGPAFFEDPLSVNYHPAWLQLKGSTRVPILAGEKVELVRGFRPFLDQGALDMLHPDVAYSGGLTGTRKIADYAALTRIPVALHSGPCSLIRFYASAHLAASIQNFYGLENALGEFRGFKEKMAAGVEPAVRKGVFAVPEGPGLGLELNEDWLRQHTEKGTPYWS